jgi:malate permease and related proteins
MSSAITKTISLIILIGLGYLFQSRIRSKDQREGIKTLILSLALPATIFIALLQIDFKSDLIIIPLFALAFNVIMHLMMDTLTINSLFNLPLNQYRTLIMLIPSLAPGLSCLPFIMEYSGQGPLAMAALADVGNKVFVLIISYTIAMRWYFQTHKDHDMGNSSKIKSLLISLINEPVNIMIAVALAMLAFGLNYKSLPSFAQLSIDRLSTMMTPLVLLFIGVSIKLNWNQFRTIFAFLFFRSSIAFALSGLLLYFLPVKDLATALLIVVFPQSACSFWPFSHMAAVTTLEQKSTLPGRTFELEFAMNVLACSMPFSVMLILLVYTTGSFFTDVSNVFISAGVLFTLSLTVVIFSIRSLADYKTEPLELPSPAEGGKNTA